MGFLFCNELKWYLDVTNINLKFYILNDMKSCNECGKYHRLMMHRQAWMKIIIEIYKSADKMLQHGEKRGGINMVFRMINTRLVYLLRMIHTWFDLNGSVSEQDPQAIMYPMIVCTHHSQHIDNWNNLSMLPDYTHACMHACIYVCKYVYVRTYVRTHMTEYDSTATSETAME